MIPTKTTEEIIRATLKKSGFKSTPYIPLLDANERWVSVDVLRQKLQEILESLQKYVALNPDGSIGEHLNKTFLRTENIVRELLVELELEEAKKQ